MPFTSQWKALESPLGQDEGWVFPEIGGLCHNKTVSFSFLISRCPLQGSHLLFLQWGSPL